MNWKYEGQEFTEDLGLNTYEWKYRMSDPAIGRFWQIDPLAEDYNYQSPYNFAENRVIDSAELEGLERIYAADGKFINQVGDNNTIRVMKHNDGDAQGLINTANNTELSSEERTQAVSVLNDNSFQGYDSTDNAAVAFAFENNAESVKKDVEMGAGIYEVQLSDGEGNSQGAVSILSPTTEGGKDGTTRFVDAGNLDSPTASGFSGETNEIPMPGTLSGFVHTHGKGSNDFSGYGMGVLGGDKGVSKGKGVPVYMSNKKGELKVFQHNNNGPHRIETIYKRRVPTK